MPDLPETMRFIEAETAGGPEVLRLAIAPVPKPAAGEVLIRVAAAGINRPDIAQRQGVYPPPKGANPHLGLEVSGTIVAAGENAGQFPPGTPVCALVNGGGYAEYCIAPETQCLPFPAGYDAIRAAALPETYFTVWANLFGLGHLAHGDSVLVHGGTSGIGVTAIQLARERGASVFATAGSAEKCAACLRLGAEMAINYKEEDFAERIRTVTGGRGVKLVLDMVGAPYAARNLRCLGMDGRLVIIAFLGGAKAAELDLTPIMVRRLTVTGSTMRPRTAAQKGAVASELRTEIWPVLDAGRCGPVIHRVFPLAEAAAAHALMESSSHIGKIMLSVT